jgi:hypothetical protein
VLDHFRVAMAVPQVLLRVDVDPDGEAVPEPTPRRPVRDVLEIRRWAPTVGAQRHRSKR